MGMVVRTNMAAIGANNALAQASKAQQSGMQKLYTGLKINAAKDDASGLAISEKMKNQIKALDTAKDNCEDGANMIQTAEGYMKETHDILTRMTELSEKAANGLLKDEDRNALQNEMDQLCGEIDRMASTANFNGVKLLDGSLGSKEKVKVESVEGKGLVYSSPNKAAEDAAALYKDENKVAGMKVDNSAFVDGEKYQLTQADNVTSGFDKVTVKFTKISKALDGSDGLSTVANETGISVDLKVKDGDKFTVSSTYTGTGTDANVGYVTSDGGFKFSGTGLASYKGATFTYSEADQKWKTEDGTELPTSNVNMNVDAKAATTYDATADSFTYNKDAADYEANGTAPEAETNGLNLQIGESSTTADRLTVSINSFHTDALFGGLDGLVNTANDDTDTASTAAVKIKAPDADDPNSDANAASTYKAGVTIDITDKDAASAAADAIRQIANYVSDERGKLGAQQNRLEHTVNNLATASENTTAAKSRILDTDMAKEMMEYTSKNVIAQAAQSMLAQANSQPQNVLSLLQ